MVRNDIDKKKLAAILSVSEKTAANKLSGTTAFTVPEAKIIMKLFPASCTFDYLFSIDSDARSA
jgi:plasmid maintenance system antidote protein VapI